MSSREEPLRPWDSVGFLPISTQQSADSTHADLHLTPPKHSPDADAQPPYLGLRARRHLFGEGLSIMPNGSSEGKEFHRSISPSRNSVAAGLGPQGRKKLALEVLAQNEAVVRLAARNGVSRQFLYRQADKASEALDEAFDQTSKDEDVLFYLPVTKSWIRQFVLELTLVGHAPFRGVMVILKDLLQYKLSIGSVHNILKGAVEIARKINAQQDLSGIRVGAHDEIFQSGMPVLAGVDVVSTFCYLLTLEDHRDATTWGVHLLDLIAQGLDLDRVIADAGSGLRAGQKAAWGDAVPCDGDVFHILKELGKLLAFLDNRAFGAMSAREKFEKKMEKAKKRKDGQALSKKLGYAREGELKAVTLADEVRILLAWLKDDILSLAGPDLATRRKLFDYIVAELRERESLCQHRIRPVRRALENQRDDLLGFAGVLEEKLLDIAFRFAVPAHLVHAICELSGRDKETQARWEQEANLREELGRKYYEVEKEVKAAMANTPRASSLVENLNSRLRSYFFLRRHIGSDYLDLLRFFLNHRKFLRSDRPERVGKSPTEILTGKPHPHWLEMLGFNRFKLN
jgi:hypothetical protein